MKNQFINDLKKGTAVDSVFLLIKKILKKKKSGEDYCLVCLQDKGGCVDGVIWAEAFRNSHDFEEGDFVSVKGEISDYRGSRQLVVSLLKKLDEMQEKEIDYSDFIRTTKKDIAEMFSELKRYIERIENKFIKNLLGLFFDDEDFSRIFCQSSAAVQYHHAYKGGLLEHTLSMVKICDFLSKNYENLNRDLLVCGAILHDIGKIYEYSAEKKGALIKITDEGRLLGHITIGFGMVLKKIDSMQNFPKDLRDRLLHIILSHHGHKEFGSPKRPKILEAFIVYHVDHLDADVGGFNFILDESSAQADWSEFLRNFERSVFLKRPDFDDYYHTEVNRMEESGEAEDYSSALLNKEGELNGKQDELF